MMHESMPQQGGSSSVHPVSGQQASPASRHIFGGGDNTGLGVVVRVFACPAAIGVPPPTRFVQAAKRMKSAIERTHRIGPPFTHTLRAFGLS
jgi:hypothetical protein